jgi:aconitase A
MGVRLTGKLPDRVSAKNVILEMLLQESLITVMRKKSGEAQIV